MTPRSAVRIAAAANATPTFQPKTTRGFRIAVVVVVVFLVAQLGVAVFGALIGEREYERATLDTFSYVGDITAERVARIAGGSRDIVEDTVASLGRPGVSPRGDDLARALYQRLDREPQARALYVGYPDGSYLHVRREGGGYVERRMSGADGTMVDTFRDATFTPFHTEVIDLSYDPRERPWYLTGASAEGSVWTDPFLLVETSSPAVSVARAARIDGDLVAVVAADLSLGSLATVLDELPVGAGAEAFVLDADRRIIAAPSQYTKRIEQFSAMTGQVPLAQDVGIDETVDFGTVREGEVFGLDGERYVLERPFDAHEELSWVLHLEAGESQLSPGLERVQWTLAWVTGISTIIVIMAGGLLYRLWHPLEQMRLRASTDALTGLSNRHEFEVRGKRLLQSAHRAGDTVVVATMDLDEFKVLNDVQGHQIGDRALQVVGRTLLMSMRERDVAARLGGDEFAVVQRVKGHANAHDLVERIRADVSAQLAQLVTGGDDVGVTAGFSVSGRDHTSLATLVGEADAALVAGKRTGKGATYASAPASKLEPVLERRTV
jgi:diguanylate cyclase (GGDEF)-like protein